MKAFFPLTKKKILAAISEIKKEGREIIFTPGNRDYFADTLVPSPFSFTGDRFRMILPSGEKIHFEHGDKINLSDRNYLAWADFSRTSAVKAAMETLPRKLTVRIKMHLEDKLAETNLSHRIALPLGHLIAYAKSLKEENVDILVLGHFHTENHFDLSGIKIHVLPRFFPGGSFCRIDGKEEFCFTNLSN